MSLGGDIVQWIVVEQFKRMQHTGEIPREKQRRVQIDSATQNQVSIRMEVDSKKCHNAVEANLPITKKWMQICDDE